MVVKQTSAQTAKPNSTMFFAIAMAMVGAMMFGLDQGNFGVVSVFEDFETHWCDNNFGDKNHCHGELVKENKEWDGGFILWGGTLITFGAAAGALTLGPVMMHKIGRRRSIGIGGFICCLGCLLASFLSFGSIPVFYVGRFITGFGVGVACLVLPVYNSECSTPSIRGLTGSFFQLNVAVGSLVATLVCTFYKNWAFGMFLPGLAGAILTVASFFLPESPRWMMASTGNYEKGRKELQKIREGNVDIEATEMWDEIQAEKDMTEVSYAGLFEERNLRKRVLIACGLVMAQQLTGVNAFLSYSGVIFGKCGFDDPIVVTLVFNLWMILFVIIGLVLIDSKYGGRRSQLLAATVIMGPPLIVASLGLQMEWNPLIVAAMVCIYGGGFQLAWGMVPWIYPSEIFSMLEKEKALSVAVFVNYMFNALIVYITPLLMNWSIIGTFYVFAILNIGCGLFVWTFVRETKGIALELTPALFDRPEHKGEDSDSDSEDSDGESSD